MQAVKRYDVLDTPPDGAFDRVTSIAARRIGVPIAIISIVDHDRIWFKSHHGVDVVQVGRDPGLCASAILKVEPHILVDASKDLGALANPLVAGEFGLRFYAGVPLRTHDGFNLGTLCVIDKVPRPIDREQIADLEDLASVVMDQLELRLSARRAVTKANLLAREIDHRVMNSLQFVSSMLRLQASRTAGSTTPEILDAAANRVAAVARVHRHFHVDEGGEKTDAMLYLRRLCKDLSEILGVTIDVNGDSGELPTKAIQPLGLIVNELVTNAAKHGAGKVTVLYTAGDRCKLMVCDEGEGLPRDFNLASNERGLGMKIVDVLAKQLGGEFTAGVNPSGVGACLIVTFPDALRRG